MNQSIAIVGASTRAAAASAKRAGFQPIAADLFADADLRLIATTTRISPYPEGFLDWLRTIEPPAWMYTGALENHPELIDQMAWIAPLWGNPGDVLQRIRSPWELAAVLRDARLLFPETRESADGLPRDGLWLAKTYQGASGSGVRAFKIPLPPREGLGEGSYDSSAVYQRRIPGTPAAAVFVADGGAATLLGITQQLIGEDWLGSHGFQYCGSIGPLPVDGRTHAAIEHIGNTLAAEFELVGLFGVDMILDADGAWTLEVNPRYTASVEIVERFTGIRATELHAAACAGSTVNPPADARTTDGRAHGKAILFAKREITISEAFAKVSLAEGLKLPWPTLADVSPAHSLIEVGRPILTIFAEGTNIHDVEHRLRQRAVGLERELYHTP